MFMMIATDIAWTRKTGVFARNCEGRRTYHAIWRPAVALRVLLQVIKNLRKSGKVRYEIQSLCCITRSQARGIPGSRRLMGIKGRLREGRKHL
jgi:hypothetical protein